MFRSRNKNPQTFRVRSPFQDVNIDMANTPSFHLEPARFVQIDRIRADQRGAVIINNILVLGADDSESGAEGEYRPIGCGAAAFGIGKSSANGVASATVFAARIRRRPHVLKPSRVRPAGGQLSGARLFCATGEKPDADNYKCKFKAGRHLATPRPE